MSTLCISTEFGHTISMMKDHLTLLIDHNIKPSSEHSKSDQLTFRPILYPLESIIARNLLAMCHQTAPKHPSCGHAAHGTAMESSKLEICRKARSHSARCLAPSWKLVDVARAYCDHCIAHGEILAQSRGLDPGIYCQRFNVSYHDLEAANPGVFPAAHHGLNNQPFSDQQDTKDDTAFVISQNAGKTRA